LTTGNVTVGGGIALASNGYNFSPFALSSMSATINSTITGSSGFTKLGDGTLFLNTPTAVSAGSGFTGTVTVSAGRLAIVSDAAIV